MRAWPFPVKKPQITHINGRPAASQTQQVTSTVLVHTRQHRVGRCCHLFHTTITQSRLNKLTKHETCMCTLHLVVGSQYPCCRYQMLPGTMINLICFVPCCNQHRAEWWLCQNVMGNLRATSSLCSQPLLCSFGPGPNLGLRALLSPTCCHQQC